MNNITYFHKSAFDDAVTEANLYTPLETGGVLMGYFKQPENIPVVLIATASGPEAIHQKYHYYPDHKYDELLVAEIYKKSDRKITYLGDWHTHPEPSTKMSFRDKKTLRRIASYKPARVSTPIMLILSLLDVWVPNIWKGELEGRCFFGKKIITEKQTIQLFE